MLTMKKTLKQNLLIQAERTPKMTTPTNATNEFSYSIKICYKILNMK